MSIEIQRKMPKSTIITMEHPFERIAMKALLIALALLACAYLYFVSASVLNVIARKDALRQTIEMTSKIAMLEQRYFDLSQGMTTDSAQNLGLAPVEATAYVYRPGTVGVVYTADEVAGIEI